MPTARASRSLAAAVAAAGGGGGGGALVDDDARDGGGFNSGLSQVRCTHPSLRTPGPPNLIMSRQLMHWPQFWRKHASHWRQRTKLAPGMPKPSRGGSGGGGGGGSALVDDDARDGGGFNSGFSQVRCTHPSLRTPGPPNLIMSRQLIHWPQSWRNLHASHWRQRQRPNLARGGGAFWPGSNTPGGAPIATGGGGTCEPRRLGGGPIGAGIPKPIGVGGMVCAHCTGMPKPGGGGGSGRLGGRDGCLGGVPLPPASPLQMSTLPDVAFAVVASGVWASSGSLYCASTWSQTCTRPGVTLLFGGRPRGLEGTEAAAPGEVLAASDALGHESGTSPLPTGEQ